MLERLDTILRHITSRKETSTLPPWSTRSWSSPFAVPNAVEWLVCADDAEREDLAHVLATLMREVRPRDWTRLSGNFRTPWIKPRDVAHFRGLPADDAVEMLGVATLSASGYTREAALKALRDLGHPRAIPYTLLRLGDWVEEVRDAAAETLQSLMRWDVAAQLIEHHTLIDHLESIERVDLDAVKASILEYLRRPASRAAVRGGLDDDRVDTRLFCLRLIQDEVAVDAELLERAVNDADPTVRRWVAGRVVSDEFTVPERLFRRLLCDRASVVSITLIRSLSLEGIAAHVDDLTELGLADAKPIRSSARFALRDRADVDLREIARRRLDLGEVTAGAVACLGETGTAEDFDLVSGFRNNGRSRVRAAAVSAMGVLDHSRAAPDVVAYLDDPSGRVRRAAAQTLAASPRDLWVGPAYEILKHGSQGGQVAAFNLLTSKGSWEALPPLLAALLSPHRRLRERAWQGLYDWHRKFGSSGWIKASPDDLNRIASLWERVRELDADPPSVSDAWSEVRHLVGEEMSRSEASRDAN